MILSLHGLLHDIVDVVRSNYSWSCCVTHSFTKTNTLIVMLLLIVSYYYERCYLEQHWAMYGSFLLHYTSHLQRTVLVRTPIVCYLGQCLTVKLLVLNLNAGIIRLNFYNTWCLIAVTYIMYLCKSTGTVNSNTYLPVNDSGLLYYYCYLFDLWLWGAQSVHFQPAVDTTSVRQEEIIFIKHCIWISLDLALLIKLFILCPVFNILFSIFNTFSTGLNCVFNQLY